MKRKVTIETIYLSDLINSKIFAKPKVAWYKDKLNWYVIIAWSAAALMVVLNLMKG